MGILCLSWVSSTSLWTICFSCFMLLWTGHDSPKDEALCLVCLLCSQRATVANIKAQQRRTSGPLIAIDRRKVEANIHFPVSPTTLKPPPSLTAGGLCYINMCCYCCLNAWYLHLSWTEKRHIWGNWQDFSRASVRRTCSRKCWLESKFTL